MEFELSSVSARRPENAGTEPAVRMAAVIPFLTLVGFLPKPPLMALTPQECSAAQRAHELLLVGSFQVERTFTLTVNGKLKNREVAHLSFSAGALEIEVLEYQAFSKMWTYENEGKDFVLEIPFACERLEATGEGRFELTSEDGLEVAELELDDSSGAFEMVAWRSDDTARLLLKKFEIAARAEYSGFDWQ